MPFAILVLVLAAGWRVFALYVPELSNFSPLMALAFCSGAYTRNKAMWIAPFAALVLSDLYIDHYYATVYHYQWSLAGAALRTATGRPIRPCSAPMRVRRCDCRESATTSECAGETKRGAARRAASRG